MSPSRCAARAACQRRWTFGSSSTERRKSFRAVANDSRAIDRRPAASSASAASTASSAGVDPSSSARSEDARSRWNARISSSSSPARSLSHAANRACCAARADFESPPYATSRISTCLNLYARSPEIDERVSGRTSSRSTRLSSCGAISSSSGDRCVSAPSQKIRPIRAARWISRFSAAGSRSMRAAISACSVFGMPAAIDRVPSDSASMRTVSSTKSGLPSVTSRISARHSCPSVVPAISASISCSASASPSGSSSIAAERNRPPPHDGRTSSSSGRASAMMISGASRTYSARCSISSRSGSSAQWMSSKTSTSGCGSASFAPHSRAAQAISWPVASASTASSTPDALASRSAIASSSQQARSLSNASRTGSSSWMPAETFTISASGQ